MKLMFYSHAIKTHFHNKGFALSLVLKVIGTRKWPLFWYFLRQPLYNFEAKLNGKSKGAHEPKAQTGGAYPGFLNMKHA